uniref:Integrase zinc-binding domain-containing protein n=1 Tax=Fagus sylvatica TaxID=28930 RepID=A0A2N9GAF1_FAGSY
MRGSAAITQRHAPLVHKLVRAGYYWPTMQKDAISYTRACDKCQRIRKPHPFTVGDTNFNDGTLAICSMEAWTSWDLSQSERRQLKFLVVGINYFTKWVEAEPLATITEKNDHPQANGQVEVTNRSLLKMIRTRLEGAKGLWLEELPNVLWAYRTTARTPTGESPFRLTFGTEAIIPVEIGVTNFRTNEYDEDNNDNQLRLNLDLLDEARDQAEAKTKAYQQRIARYHDRRVKHREFRVGDLVLRKVTLATKDPTQGKLGPTWEGAIQSQSSSIGEALITLRSWTAPHSCTPGMQNT